MAVLVTGGAGYIGSHTAVALGETGRDVVIVDNFVNSSPRAVDAVRALTTAEVALVEADLCDGDAVRRVFARHPITEVVHFAAYKAVAESVDEPLAYYRNNLDSLLGLLEAMLDNGVGRLVHSSSCTVYGQPEVLPVSESAPVGAESPYGRTKLMSEQIITDVCAVRPMDAMMLRYFNPVGAHPSGEIGEDPAGEPANLVPRIMLAAAGRAERLRVYGGDYDSTDGTAVRDYVHVMDLAEGHAAALDADIAPKRSRVYNLGTGSGTTVLQVLAAAAYAVGAPIPHEIAERRPGDVEACWADCTRAREELAWQARRTLPQMLADHWHFASRPRQQ